MLMIKGQNVEPAFGAAQRHDLETVAQQRRRQRIALIEEFGGGAADLRRVALEAMKRGMYSPRTNLGDVELCLHRTWTRRNRLTSRSQTASMGMQPERPRIDPNWREALARLI